MSLVAKFHLSQVSSAHINGGAVKLSAVSRGDRNAAWSQASPSGNMEMACDETELQFWMQLRDQARVINDFQQRLAVERTEATGVQHRAPHVGVEVFLYLSREARNGSITRLLNLDSVTKSTHTPDQGSCDWTSINGGGYTTLHMHINNPAAYTPMATAFEQGKLEWYLSIEPSTDGYPGDGHEFRESSYPAGIWGHGLCGVCFGKPEEH